jgi:hypothetical protein
VKGVQTCLLHTKNVHTKHHGHRHRLSITCRKLLIHSHKCLALIHHSDFSYTIHYIWSYAIKFLSLDFSSSFFNCEFCYLTLNLLMSYIYVASSKARNLTSCIYGRDFLLGILLPEPCTSLIYAWKTNKYTNFSFSLLIMYGSPYMFRHYIAIFRERS